MEQKKNAKKRKWSIKVHCGYDYICTRSTTHKSIPGMDVLFFHKEIYFTLHRT